MYSLLFSFIKKTSLNVPVAKSLYIHIHDCFHGKGPSNKSMVVCFGSIHVRIHGQAVYLQREGNPEEEWGVGYGVMTTKKVALCGQLELNRAACRWQPGQKTWWIDPTGGTRPVGSQHLSLLVTGCSQVVFITLCFRGPQGQERGL